MVDIRTVVVQSVESDGEENELLREREKTPMPISEDSESDWNEPSDSSNKCGMGERGLGRSFLYVYPRSRVTLRFLLGGVCLSRRPFIHQ